MGKTGKTLKRRRLAESLLAPPAATSGKSTSSLDVTFLGGLIAPEDLATTVRTLAILGQNTELLTNSRSELKGLRNVVYDFQRLSNELNGTGTSLTSRISTALAGGRWTDSLVLLAELKIRKLEPRLGALQRWVRDCDAASQLDGTFGDSQVLVVLDAILRTTTNHSITESDVEMKGEGPVRRMEDWIMRESSGSDSWSRKKANTLLLPSEKDSYAAPFRLLQTTLGPDRLPPNHFPALLYTTTPPLTSTAVSSLVLEPAASRKTGTTRIEVPNVPHAFLLADVLSLDECEAIVKSAEAVGFAEDAPVGDSIKGESILAHNLYWLTDVPFISTFFERLQHLLPPILGGGKVRGINRRFRVYRYVPGAIYRPHIDGAWPASGIDKTTGEYLYDDSPAGESQWSRLTFLLYLNDDFGQGQTTFFLPSKEDGIMNAFPVKPRAGCALLFPHGEARDSLLHEGSPVAEGGGKALSVSTAQSASTSNSNSVYVSNLSPETSETTLTHFFSFCGGIDSIVKDSDSNATITFKKDSAAKTALLLSGGVLDSREISVGRTKSEALAGSHLPADTTTPSTTTTENDTEIEQEDKPHSAIVAEYLAHGYALSDTVIEKAIASDREYGISAKFANFFNPLAAKAQPHVDSLTSKLADLDEKKGVSLKGKAALTIGNHYYSQVLASPFGARVLAFYTNTSKQVMDVHEEALRIKEQRLADSSASTAAPSASTSSTAGTASGKEDTIPGYSVGSGSTTAVPEKSVPL